MNLKNMMSKRSQTKMCTLHDSTYKSSKTGKLIHGVGNNKQVVVEMGVGDCLQECEKLG